MTHRILSGVLLACALSILSACQTSEERAEDHFATAQKHIENGDLARAKVEFQNVFKLNGRHRDARATFARMQRENGDTTSAYGQFLRLVEQYPDDIEGRAALAELALDAGNWDELKRHGEYLAKLVPDNLTARVAMAAIAYREAVVSKDEPARREAQTAALALNKDHPEIQGLRRLLIDDYLRLGDWKNGLEMVDTALADQPKSLELQRTRLKILYQLNDPTLVEIQLKGMVEDFPQDTQIVAALIQWYMSRGEIDKAEASLRAGVNPLDENAEAGATLVRFLSEFRGSDAAKAELDKLIDGGSPHQALYRSLRASINFDIGLQDQAIKEMQSILATSEPSEETDNAKVALAHMLEITDNPVGARALIEEVLERDSTHTAALKRRAGWLIDDDLSGDAIVALRAALADNPRDAEIMTLMARAHERDGNRELMAEMLALAVENSGEAPEESLRYAQLLISQKKYLPAESILKAALRKVPDNVQLLSSLGGLYITMQDWGRTDDVTRALRAVDATEAVAIANDLTARRLAAQNRDNELNAFLETISNGTADITNADIAIIRQHIKQNNPEKALSHIDGLLKTAPNAPLLLFIKASVLAQNNQASDAEAILQSLLEQNDQNQEIWVALFRLQRSIGNTDQASKTLAAAREALPDSPQIKWIAASELELSGDINGAIGIYEELYAADSNNKIIANNLASLLADHRADTESLERAYTVARRLRGTKFAPFQDTYGWITYRLQNYDEAVAYLEPAAAGMGTNATVQFHLAMAYAAVNRNEEALAQFEKTKAMLDADNLPSFAATIDEGIERLNNAPVEDAD